MLKEIKSFMKLHNDSELEAAVYITMDSGIYLEITASKNSVSHEDYNKKEYLYPREVEYNDNDYMAYEFESEFLRYNKKLKIKYNGIVHV